MSQTFPPVRLAALDLDGTLLNHEGQVTPRTRAALQAASDRGVVVVPTTGRPLGNLPPVVAQLPGVLPSTHKAKATNTEKGNLLL